MTKHLSTQPPNIQWMVVYITYNVPEAHIVAGRLQYEGISALIHWEPAASALGIHIGPLGEVKVLVHPQDYDRALTILGTEAQDTLPETTDPVTYLPDDEDENDDE